MRKAKYAGEMYEKATSLLDEQIKSCFEGPKGPGALPSSITDKKVNAVIVPHADYKTAGQAYAWSYKSIAEQGMSDLYIIIAPNTLTTETALTTETFETPYGLVRVDQHFARELVMKGNVKENKKLHEDSSAIELQVPFLQFIFKKNIEKIKILPLLIGHDTSREQIKKLVTDVKEVMIDMNKNPCFIICSDFTKYGREHKFIPFGANVKQNIYKMDEVAINLIKDFKADEFLNLVEKELMNISGTLPIYFILNFLKKANVLLEQYYTSADLNPESSYKNSESFASILFE